jgi:hypothetical protein
LGDRAAARFAAACNFNVGADAMTPFERKDIPWIVAIGIAVVIIILIVTAYNA